MSTAIVVGLIGLGGALVGAGAAFAGVVYQQRHQERLTRQQQLDEMGSSAANTLIAEFQEVHDLYKSAPFIPYDRDATDRVIAKADKALDKHIINIRVASLRLPHPELREAIEAACEARLGASQWAREALLVGDDLLIPYITKRVAIEAQNCLGAYLRQESDIHLHFLSRIQAGANKRQRSFLESYLEQPEILLERLVEQRPGRINRNPVEDA